MSKKGENTKKLQRQREHERKRSMIAQIYFDAKNGDLDSKDKEEYIEEIAKYWLLKHGGTTIRLNGPSEHYGAWAIIGAVIGLIIALIGLYYLPV